jgi:hypothetical protein
MEEVLVGKRVMRQSLFAGEQLVLPPTDMGGAISPYSSPFVAYILAGAALLVALIALAVAVFK